MIEHLSLKKVTALHADEIQQTIHDVVDSGQYLQGQQVRAFEDAYARFIGTRHCVGCGNGLDALTLIIRAYKEMGIMREGDEIIVPANTYIASILAITENRLKPILVEPRLDTLEINDTLIEQAITPHTRAIMIVHLYGRCAYSEQIGEICQVHHLKLIEDNAQAQGCKVLLGGKITMTGALGDASAHSFYPTKNLGALGDAGAVTTNDNELAECIHALANYGSSKKYVFPYIGKNSRIDEIQAAVLNVKLKYLEKENDRRRQIACYYEQHILREDIFIPSRTCTDKRQNVYHLFPILCSFRNLLQPCLTRQGIQTVIHYPIPPHKQACYAEWNALSFPVTEQIHREELSLPCNPALTDEEIGIIVHAIQHFRI